MLQEDSARINEQVVGDALIIYAKLEDLQENPQTGLTLLEELGRHPLAKLIIIRAKRREQDYSDDASAYGQALRDYLDEARKKLGLDKTKVDQLNREAISAITNQLAEWENSRGSKERLVHDALRSFNITKNLGKNILVELKIVEAHHRAKNYQDNLEGHGLALKEVLNNIIETKIRPPGPLPLVDKDWKEFLDIPDKIIEAPDSVDNEQAPLSKSWQKYLIIRFFIKGIEPEIAILQLEMAFHKRAYEDRVRRIIEEIASVLDEWESTESLPPTLASLPSSLPITGPKPLPPIDSIHIERKTDNTLKNLFRTNHHEGITITIRAPRRTGKTTLLVQAIRYARQQGMKDIFIDLREFDEQSLRPYDFFLRALAEKIVDEQGLGRDIVEEIWHKPFVATSRKLTMLMELNILPSMEKPIIVALDEVDRLLDLSHRYGDLYYYDDFFALLRAWHNKRKIDIMWRKFNLVMVISTEPNALIRDLSRSPFNVGEKITLKDFTKDEVYQLNHQFNSPLRTEEEIDDMMELLGGHPYLTKEALKNLNRDKSKTWADLRRDATDYQDSPFASHLRYLHSYLADQTDLGDAFKQFIAGESQPDDMEIIRLLRAGLIKKEKFDKKKDAPSTARTYYSPRCKLYVDFLT